MSGEDRVRKAFADQAVWCDRLGSPLTARLMAALGPRLDRSTECGAKILDWPGDPNALGDAVPLRLAGVLHGLVRRGRLMALAALYPPNPLPDTDTLATVALAALEEEDAEICAWLDLPPQTNEVARSGILYPGFMQIARETGLPLALHEIGTSAGLNLVPDRYAYTLGGRICGRAGSAVHLAPDWRGPAPDGPEPAIESRRGCDLSPLDLSRARDRERLVGYIWPDQSGRLERVEAAIALALEELPALEAVDAGKWVCTTLRAPPRPGVTRVLFHSIMHQYLPAATRGRIADCMERSGSEATADAPLAWLAFEQFEREGPRLTVRLWPGDGAERVLARADPHVHAVTWEG